MATKPDNNDDDSFIILSPSLGPSYDVQCNGIPNGDVPLAREQFEDALKDLSIEANMAFKAHFQLGDSPSPASMILASTIISDDKSTEDLQKHFGELLDQNVILMETLKQNNDSMKEQFLTIAACQEDMMRTHVLHKQKFIETKELIERLRQENKTLKLEVVRLAEAPSSSISSGKPLSALEFVTSPDDDTVNKLTSQLELVEKQRRQLVIENDKLTWQKESLENIQDATFKEKEELRDKLTKLELKETEYKEEINNLKSTVRNLTEKIQTVGVSSSAEEDKKRDEIQQHYQMRLNTLQNELKNAQLKILELENVKLEFSKHKSIVIEMVKTHREQIQELNNKLKVAQTTVFQPIRTSMDLEAPNTSERSGLLANIKMYDQTLKHLSELLNSFIHSMCDNVVQILSQATSLQEFKLETVTADQFKTGLLELKSQLEKQYVYALNSGNQIKSALAIFEGIFKDYNELLKKDITKQQNVTSSAGNVEALTAALLARGQELRDVKEQLHNLRTEKDDCDLLKAQLDLYKSDFEAEREARQKMASDKEVILRDLRTTQRRNQELIQQLEEVRQKNPTLFQKVTTAKKSSTTSQSPGTDATTSGATGNMVRKKKKVESTATTKPHDSSPPPIRFDCPVCDKHFKTLLLLQQHVDNCLL